MKQKIIPIIIQDAQFGEAILFDDEEFYYFYPRKNIAMTAYNLMLIAEKLDQINFGDAQVRDDQLA